MLTYQQECVATAKDGVLLLVPQQWEFENDSLMNPSPNWAMYEQLEKANALVALTVRNDSRLIGYMAAILHRHVNAVETAVGTISTYFVEACPSRPLILRRLFSNMVNALEKRGAKRVLAMTSVELEDQSCGRLLEAMGFKPHAMSYKLNLSETAKEARCA